MTKQVWKWDLAGMIKAPKGVEWLSVQQQHGKPCIWGLVDIEAEVIEHGILIVGTGHDMPHGEFDFIDTFQEGGGMMIFHVFCNRWE